MDKVQSCDIMALIPVPRLSGCPAQGRPSALSPGAWQTRAVYSRDSFMALATRESDANEPLKHHSVPCLPRMPSN